MKVCPSCGTLNKDENIFCLSCGEKIEGTVLFCSHCGNKIVSSNKFCKFCGNDASKSATTISPENSPRKDAYAITQIPVKTQIPPKKKRPYKKLIITLSIFLPVFFISLAIALLFAISGTTSPSYKLSPEQGKLISSLGYPGEYVIIFDRENSKRVDMWMYPELERYFMFENGIYTGGKETVHPDLKKDKIKVRPEKFIMEMKIDDVIKIAGTQPQKNTDSKSGITVLSFYNGLLTVAFNEKEEIINVTRTKEIN